MPRITRARVWLPAMPPMLATMGINTARATSFSMVASNRPMTAEARMAVSRLMPSQMVRRLEEAMTGANRSSSSFKPAMLMKL